jgi:ASC-1-like (ASCH) protein
MKNHNFSLLFLLILALSIYACKKPLEEKEVEEVESVDVVLSKEQLDSLQFAYMAVNDSLDASWTVMIKDDDEKIADMKRLLKEVSNTRRYDRAKHNSLLKEVEELSMMRYDRNSMADSDKIDVYDSATSVLTNDVIHYAANHPLYKEYPKLEEIINDIQEADNRVIIYRIRYDRSAKDFNRFVRQNQNHILQIDSNTNKWREAALFELSE